jgi:hypothetical protein
MNIATVQVGRRYPDLWITKLASMVARNLPVAHNFIVYTDRPASKALREALARHASAHQTLVVQDLQAGPLTGFFGKLRLFDQALTGTDPFLFLDSTLVIRASLEPLIAIGRSSSASVIGVRDWNYPILNSCVLWCRPDAHTQTVWDAWQQGRYADIAFPSDQNVIFHVFRETAPAALTYWPEGLVSSYKALRKLARRDPEAAQRALAASTILKFHGRPKPDEVLHPWRHPQHTILRHPLHPRLWSYLADDIRAHWC